MKVQPYPATMLPESPGWLPDDDELRRFFGNSALYPFYRLRLTEYISRLLPVGPCSVADVGAGDGSLGALLFRYRPETFVVGLEVAVRGARRRELPMICFDGRELPMASASVDVTLLSNVLHHATDPSALLREVRRVTRRRIIVKDHLSESRLDDLKLTALDVMGNLRLGAQVSATYLSLARWQELFAVLPGASVASFGGLPFRRGLMRLVFGNSLEVMFAVDLAA